MHSHALINAWGIKKYMLEEGSTVWVDSGTIHQGYCETCYYTEEVMYVHAEEPGGIRKEVDVIYDMDLATLLNQILNTTQG